MTERPTVQTPDETWTDLELLAEYNKYSTTKRRARFKTKALAIESILQARSGTGAIVDTPVPAPRKKGKGKGTVRKPTEVKARMAGLVIRIKTDANPYREESKSHAHFEKMRGGITVLEYLAKFTEQDQKNARQYLWNAIQDEHIETLGG